MGVAQFLQQHPAVERVRYPGLPDSQYAPLVARYLPRGAGAVFAFDLAGGREAGQRFIQSLQLWSHLANVGDAKSLVIHPASTTHRQLSNDELVAAGIGAGTIRLSVGLETLDDLIWDLERGLNAATASRVNGVAAEVIA
jgi:O-acetylhomoserine (thiol)-lyase